MHNLIHEAIGSHNLRVAGGSNNSRFPIKYFSVTVSSKTADLCFLASEVTTATDFPPNTTALHQNTEQASPNSLWSDGTYNQLQLQFSYDEAIFLLQLSTSKISEQVTSCVVHIRRYLATLCLKNCTVTTNMTQLHQFVIFTSYFCQRETDPIQFNS